jgi:chemotaxis family two-component system response regulator Rcp1
MAAVEQQPIEILLVEDNEPDLDLTMEALQSGKLQNRIHVARDGIEALEFLRRQGKNAGAPRPHLILLDLNMPRMDGRETLAEIKRDPDLQSIPVVVLTTSKSEEDIARSYELQCNCYINKPVDLPQFMEVVRAIEDFWLCVVQLPQR